MKLVDKSALVAEIEKLLFSFIEKSQKSQKPQFTLMGKIDVLEDLLRIIDTLEVKDANEALRTEYEKGRADVIADTLSWLENCWPKYCSNQTIIEGFKEAIKGE